VSALSLLFERDGGCGAGGRGRWGEGGWHMTGFLGGECCDAVAMETAVMFRCTHPSLNMKACHLFVAPWLRTHIHTRAHTHARTHARGRAALRCASCSPPH
jgi:hypothetical protein